MAIGGSGTSESEVASPEGEDRQRSIPRSSALDNIVPRLDS